MNLRSHQLHDIVLRVGGRIWRRASVFPLFDRSGTVDRLLIVEPGGLRLLTGEGGFAPHRTAAGLRLEVDREPAVLEEPPDVEGRFHFDPWWVLLRRPWRDHPATPALQSTNRVPRSVAHVVFRRDLARAERTVGVAGSSLPLATLWRE